MPFKEISVTLITSRKPWDTMTFMVDLDVDTSKPIDVYTYRSNYDDLPVPLKRLTWKQGSNSLFIHVSETKTAWKYIKPRAYLQDNEV